MNTKKNTNLLPLCTIYRFDTRKNENCMLDSIHVKNENCMLDSNTRKNENCMLDSNTRKKMRTEI